MKFLLNFLIIEILITKWIMALNNGLVRTPPMGWMSWERFRCIVNCKEDPKNCISEKLIVEMADLMVSDGYLAAGYQYLIIDDCWMDKERDQSGRLKPDPSRFPNGIKWLSSYVHKKGLKFGIYGDFGTLTCGGYPGSEYHLEIDAETFADWEVDYFKMDGCYSNINQFDDGYPAMGFWLNKTKRPIVYSCSWPAYQEGIIKPNYKKIAENCNLWRNYNDIEDSWKSVIDILKFYGEDKTDFIKFGGPGNFNDPDMLIIGNFGLSDEQQKSQMALWCLMAAPMLMSNDLREIDSKAKNLLLNKNAILINQDPLGAQGKRIKKLGHIELWNKDITPEGNKAFVVLNLGTSTPIKVSIKLSEIGLISFRKYNIFEVFTSNIYASNLLSSSFLNLTVNPSSVFFGRSQIFS